MTRMTDFCDLACDVCGNWEPGICEKTSDQRRHLRGQGWATIRRRGKLMDLCPRCAKGAGIIVKEAPKPPKLDL